MIPLTSDYNAVTSPALSRSTISYPRWNSVVPDSDKMQHNGGRRSGTNEGDRDSCYSSRQLSTLLELELKLCPRD